MMTRILLSNNAPAAPGGNNQDIQFNNNGAIDGSDGLQWDGANLFVAAGNVILASGYIFSFNSGVADQFEMGLNSGSFSLTYLAGNVLTTAMSQYGGDGWAVGTPGGSSALEINIFGNAHYMNDFYIQGYIRSSDNSISQDLNNRLLVDDSYANSLDYQNRYLIYHDGGTNMALWDTTDASSNPAVTFPQWVVLSNIISGYNGDTTVANGVASIVGFQNQTGLTGSLVSTPLFTPVANGLYEAQICLMTQSTGSAGTVTATLSWTDPSSTSRSVTTSSVLLTGLNTVSLVVPLYAGASTNINYSSTITGPLGGPTYELIIVLTRKS